MLAETFSQEATRLLGAERWARWGSEQVASNMIVANDPNALLLPYDHYFNFWDEGMPEDARFVHFIGSCRHSGSAYIAATRSAISAIRAAGSGSRGRPDPAQPSTGARCQRSDRASERTSTRLNYSPPCDNNLT